MRRLAFLLAAASAVALGSPAAAETAPAPPPAFRPDRTAEDYSYLRDPARRGDWSDAYKFVPLSRDGTSYLSFGGEWRERFESFDAPRFGLGGAGPDSYLLQRLVVHADLHLGPAVRVFAQLGAHEAFGKEILNAPDEDHVDVQQLFVELVPVQGMAARFGRQEMAFNPLQRFVSFRDGTNVRQNFDGGRLTFARERVRVEAFLTSPVILTRGSFDDVRNRDQQFFGLYGALRLRAQPGQSLDAYWFVLDRDSLAAGAAIGRERRHSLGLRHAGTRGRVDWDAEAVYQFGTSVGRDISAWALSADFGYAPAAAPLRPRFGLRFDAGSGDGNAADGRVASFFPLFPSGPYFNEANLTSWTNLVALRPNLRLQPSRRLTLLGGVQFKWREEVDDAVYLGPSAPLAPTRGNRAREIGQVYTLDANFQVNRNLALRGYYLHHSAGDALRAAGGRPIDFAMASATLRF